MLAPVPRGVSRGQTQLAAHGAPADLAAAVRVAEAELAAAQQTGDKKAIRAAKQALAEAKREAKQQEQTQRKLIREVSVGRDTLSLLKTLEVHIDFSIIRVCAMRSACADAMRSRRRRRPPGAGCC